MSAEIVLRHDDGEQKKWRDEVQSVYLIPVPFM